MAKRHSFVPENPAAASLEGRVVLSTFNQIGHWFSSQYSHVKHNLGIGPKHHGNAAAGIQDLWNNSDKLSKPTHHAVVAHHTSVAHPTGTLLR